MSEVHDVLVRARALIADPERWTRRTWARNALGQRTAARDPHAVKWCAEGAAVRASQASPRGTAVAAHTALDRAALDARSVLTTTFNDDPTTTHADVLDLFDRAIEATR